MIKVIHHHIIWIEFVLFMSTGKLDSLTDLSLSLSLSYTGKVWPSLRVVIISGEACDSSLASR